MKELYYSARTYFDSGCDEFRTHPIERKLLEIGYVTWHGHDIMDDIRYILENYSYVSEDDVQRAIWKMMAGLHGVDSYLRFNRGNSLETDVKLFLEDLMRVYRLPVNEPLFRGL